MAASRAASCHHADMSLVDFPCPPGVRPQINHKSVMSNIEDPEARGTMIFAWWMACLADAYRSVYYRRKPML